MFRNALLFSLASASILASAAYVTLVENGKNPVPIVLPETPTPEDEFASRELQTFLTRMSGTKFEIVKNQDELPDGSKIYLGVLPGSRKLKEGEYAIQTDGKNLYLAGNGPRGTLSATYRFLTENLGCRFLSAYGDMTIPSAKTIQADSDKVFSEGLPYRALMTFFYTNQPTADFFFLRNGQNLLLNSKNCNFLNRIQNVGKGNHSIHKFVPPSEYFKTNPEFYTMNEKGKRVPNGQICFSSPGLRKVFTKNVIEECRESYKKAVSQGQEAWIEISAMDYPGHFCCCPECTALEKKYGTPCGAFFEFLAELSSSVKKEMPKAKIASLLYRKEQTEKPPAGLVFPDNFIGIFAPIDDNIFADLDHKSNAQTLEHLRQWCKIAKNIWVWYYPDTYGLSFYPYSALHRSIRDFQLMKEAGITGTFYEHDVTPPNSTNFADLESWVLLQLFSGSEKSPEALIKEFMDLYYGKAAPLMTQYFNDLENLREKAVREGIVGYYACSPLQLGYCTTENLEKWSELFDKMESLVKSNDTELFRVRLARRQLDHLILSKWESFAKESEYAKKTSPKILADRIISTLKRVEKERQPYVSRKGDIQAVEALVTANLPEELKNIPPERIRQLFYTSGVKDPDAATGFAAQHTDLVSFPYGMYANDYRSHIAGATIQPKWTLLKNRYLKKEEVAADRYKLYKVGTFPITNATRVSVTTSAYFFRDIGIFFNEKTPDAQWDVYLSLKFEGPAVPGSKAKTNRVLCDRIVLVKP